MSEEAKTWTITLTRKCEYEVEARSKMQAIAKSYHEFDEMPSECWYQSIEAELKGEADREWPNGRISADDGGETAFAIAADPAYGIIRMQFTKPIKWLGFNVRSAKRLRDLLDEKLSELSDNSDSVEITDENLMGEMKKAFGIKDEQIEKERE